MEYDVPRGYTLHEEIFIEGDRDLTQQAKENGWPGEGYSYDPFFIEKLFISAGYEKNGIEIHDTRSHIIIQECIFYEEPPIVSDDSWWPFFDHRPRYPYDDHIRMVNVKNITVLNCNFTLNERRGVDLKECSEIRIEDSEYHYSSGNYWYLGGPVGNLLNDCQNISAVNCSFELDGGRCFVLYGSENILLLGNRQLSLGSFADLDHCDSVLISRNQFGDGKYGVFMEQTSNSTVMENTMTKATLVGVYCENGFNNSIERNSLSGFGEDSYGIFLMDSFGASIIGNQLRDHDWTLIIYNTDNNTISGNLIEDSNRSIMIASSGNNTLRENHLDVSGIWMEDDPGSIKTYTTQIIGEDNTVNGKPILYLRDKKMSDSEPPIANWGQIILGNITGLSISNIHISDIMYPIQMGACQEITISDCSFRGGDVSIFIQSSMDIDVIRSKFTGCELGSLIRTSDGILFQENSFDSEVAGCIMLGSGNCSFVGNEWKGSQLGIELEDSNNCTMISNTFHNEMGFHISRSVWSTVEDNHFRDSFPCFEDEVLMSGRQRSPTGNLINGGPAYYYIGNEDVPNPLPQDGMLYVFVDIHNKGIKKLVMRDGLDPYFLGCSNMTIEEFELSGDAGPMSIIQSKNMTIRDCIFRNLNANYSIMIENSRDCSVENNWIYGSGVGIHITDSRSTKVIQNDIRLTEFSAILIDGGSVSNTIQYNDIRLNLGDGILLNGTSNDVISRNWIEDNTGYAINACSSTSATIFQNIFIRNNGSNGTYQLNRTQVNVNNDGNDWYISNSILGLDSGNYWYDHSGPDEENDGYVDTPYVISYGYGYDRDWFATSVPFYLLRITRLKYEESERLREEEERLEREERAEEIYSEDNAIDEDPLITIAALAFFGIFFFFMFLLPCLLILGIIKLRRKIKNRIGVKDAPSDRRDPPPLEMKLENEVVFLKVKE